MDVILPNPSRIANLELLLNVKVVKLVSETFTYHPSHSIAIREIRPLRPLCIIVPKIVDNTGERQKKQYVLGEPPRLIPPRKPRSRPGRCVSIWRW